jgi:hypothetical protein
MSPPASPGSLSLPAPSSFATSTGLRLETQKGSALPTSTLSGLTGSLSLQPAELLASPTEAFTSGLSAGRSPFPPPGITTVASGQVPPAGLPPAGTSASLAARSPRFLRGPHARAPCSKTPAGRRCQAVAAPPRGRRVPKRHRLPRQEPFRGSIARPTGSLFTPRSPGRPGSTQNSLPAGGQPLPGGGGYPLGPVEKFQVTS